MKKFESDIKISFEWESDNGIDIPEKHFDALKEDAEEQIKKHIQKGHNDGELYTSVRYGKDVVPEEDEDDGLGYSGYWSIDV